MAQRSFIVIIGEYTPELTHVQDIIEASNDAEINFFSLSTTGEKDTVERINERLFVHHYAPLNDVEMQAKQYIRDIIALGAKNHYFCKSKSKHYNNLLDYIMRGVKMYGITYNEL